MDRERAHYESTVSEKRRKERIFGRILKNYKKDMKKYNTPHF
jgi:ribosome biogenesis GTPase / thiamine phosphate phosphatase